MMGKLTKKRLLMLVFLMITCALPLSSAWAAGTDGQEPPQGMFGAAGSMLINTKNLSEDQLKSYAAAKAAYEQAEDGILKDLVSVGELTEADVQAYQQTRAQQPSQPPQEQPQQGQPAQAATPPTRGEGSNIWSKFMQGDMSVAVQNALEALNQVGQIYQQALQDAGIDVTNRGARNPGGQ